jgi:mannose-6-phosphate isomerase-like protein (cupin superfamily)
VPAKPPKNLYKYKKESNMTGYVGKIEEKTVKNNYFREVVFTGKNCQLVVMSLRPGEEIGSEVHKNVDQFFRVEEGRGKVIIDGEETLVINGAGIVIPAGSEHNVINLSSKSDLKLYTIYSPPQHKDGIIHKTKKEAMADETDHL